MNQLLEILGKLLTWWDSLYGKTRNGVRHVYEQLQVRTFSVVGKSPRDPGYGAYRERKILESIRHQWINTGLPASYGRRLDERIVEYPWVFSRLPQREGRLLDAGSVLNHDALLRLPVLAEKRIFISTLAPESSCSWWRNISYVYEDLRDACFKDDYFDWIVCLSTLEHVGMDNAFYTSDPSKREKSPQDAFVFLKQVHRMLKPEGVLYLSFPFGKAADLGWLQVFDNAAVEKMIQTFQPRLAVQNYFRYGAQGWRMCTSEEASNAGYFDSHRETGENPLGVVAAEAVACLELVK